ncbi:hypothetical protein L873DRAFT_1777753, partial [Choiromyces venosus 120613-1]
MDIVCPDCGALHWISERIVHRGKRNPKFESCCKHGDLKLPLLEELLEPLKSLINGQESVAKEFRKHLRQWNSAFAFTSVSHNMDNRDEVAGAGVQTFQVHGELYHLQGPLRPQAPQDACYSQMYLYDPEYSAELRSGRFHNLAPEVVRELTDMLYQYSPYIRLYRTVAERLTEQEAVEGEPIYTILLNPRLELVVNGGADPRRANMPTTNEVAIVVPEEYGEKGFRDIVLAKRYINGQGEVMHHRFSRINQNHAAYIPLHYVMMFPK